jgi:hypothetical protein
MQLEREWSYEDALDAHELLDALEAAQTEAHARARDEAEHASAMRGLR